MKTLYISDLDGTLLNRSSRLSDYSLQGLNHLIRNGLPFTYATARSLSSASKTTAGLELTLPVIVYNGGMIRDISTGRLLFMEHFTAEEQTEIQTVLTVLQIRPLVYSFLAGTERVSWITGSENSGTLHYLSHRRGDPRLRPLSCANDLYDGDIFYYTCIGEYQELLPAYDYFKLRSTCRCTLFKEPSREEYWCELMPSGVSKANAVLKLKELLRMERIITFGDAWNDLPMFQISDQCYAVASAVPELKEAADGIIGENDEDGVVKWLERHFTAEDYR